MGAYFLFGVLLLFTLLTVFTHRFPVRHYTDRITVLEPLGTLLHNWSLARIITEKATADSEDEQKIYKALLWLQQTNPHDGSLIDGIISSLQLKKQALPKLVLSQEKALSVMGKEKELHVGSQKQRVSIGLPEELAIEKKRLATFQATQDTLGQQGFLVLAIRIARLGSAGQELGRALLGQIVLESSVDQVRQTEISQNISLAVISVLPKAFLEYTTKEYLHKKERVVAGHELAKLHPYEWEKQLAQPIDFAATAESERYRVLRHLARHAKINLISANPDDRAILAKITKLDS